MKLTQSLPDSAEDYLRYARDIKGLAAHSISRYRVGLAHLALSHTDFDALSTAQLQKILVQHHSAGQSAKTLAAMLSGWRGYYAWRVALGLLHANPCDSLRAPKAAKRLPKALAVDATQALLDQSSHNNQANLSSAEVNVFNQSRNAALLELLYGCGLRASECVGLDLAAGDGSLGWLEAEGNSLRVTGKGARMRIVPIPQQAQQLLQQWLTHRQAQLSQTKQAAQAADTPRALFINAKGRRISTNDLRKIVASVGRDGQLGQHLHPHMLRHSYASHLLQSSGDLRAVQELLGHKSIAATQVYTQLDFQHLAKVYDQAHPRAKVKTQT